MATRAPGEPGPEPARRTRRTDRGDDRYACPGCVRVPGDWAEDGGLVPCRRCIAWGRFAEARFRARRGYRPWAGEPYERPWRAFRVAVRAEVAWWIERTRRRAQGLEPGHGITRKPWWRQGVARGGMVRPTVRRGNEPSWIILDEAAGEGQGRRYRWGSQRLAWRLALERWRGTARRMAEPAQLAASTVEGVRRARWRLRGFGSPWGWWLRYRVRRRWLNPPGRPLEPAQLAPGTWHPWERWRRWIGVVAVVEPLWPEVVFTSLWSASGHAVPAEPAVAEVPPQGRVDASDAGSAAAVAPLDEPAREGDQAVERAQRTGAGSAEGSAEVADPVPGVDAPDVPRITFRPAGPMDETIFYGPGWYVRLSTAEPDEPEPEPEPGRYKRVTLRWPGNDAAGSAGRHGDTEPGTEPERE